MLPATSCSPGSMYSVTVVDITAGDSYEFMSQRIDIFKFGCRKVRMSKDEEEYIWDNNISPNEKYSRWDFWDWKY